MIVAAAEKGWLPDAAIRFGIRRLLKERLETEHANNEAAWRRAHEERMEAWRQAPVAIEADLANEQHYEVPADFFGLVLGARRKYSCCHFNYPEDTLDQAEEASLALACERAELEDGQRVLELGCGWGSLTLWMAEKYPNSKITAISNSASQRAYIERMARERGFNNLTVKTVNVASFSTDNRFDRVVSVEMFEHVRNHAELMRRINGWLAPGGKLFVHVFCHRNLLYPFETDGQNDWMARHFFSGGMMPSYEFLTRFDEHMQLDDRWRVNGRHYQLTSECWLKNLDANFEQALRVLHPVAGSSARQQVGRWRMFFMACAELFGYAGGGEWHVGHYRFRRPAG